MPCNPSVFIHIEMFKLLDEHERADLAKVVDELNVTAGETLFRAGEPGDTLFVIQSGRVELSIKDNAGQKIVLATREAGDIFGELSLLDSGPRTATAQVLEDSVLLVLDRSDLILLFQKRPEAALDMLTAMSGMTRKADDLLRSRVSRNVNEEMQVHSTVLQRIADWIAWFSGSMPFLMINGGWFIVWIIINTFSIGIPAFDPYPFGLLTMIVSLEAIFLSCFVLISQNRQAEKDRVRSDIEYEVNIKAEMEIGHLHEKTDQIYVAMLDRFAKLEKMVGR